MRSLAHPTSIEFSSEGHAERGQSQRPLRIWVEGRAVNLETRSECWRIDVGTAERWPSPDGSRRHPVTLITGAHEEGDAIVRRTLEVNCGRTPPTIVFEEHRRGTHSRTRRLVITHPEQDRLLDLIEAHLEGIGLPALENRYEAAY